MALNKLDIQANVYDLRKDIPRKEDKFLVDSNVWYLCTYTRASNADNPNRPQAYRVQDYSRYIEEVICTKATIFYCGLSLSELAHSIEKTEFKIYNSLNPPIDEKPFRRSSQRLHVAQEIKVVWEQVQNMGKLLNISIDEQAINSSLSYLNSYPIDSYDSLLLYVMHKHNVANIITDDSDFSSIQGINMFTANAQVINTARSQRKLIGR